MFKIVKERVIRNWPATISESTDNGKVDKHEITLDLLIIDTDEFKRLSLKGDEAILQEVIKGWDGIGDLNGKPLAFSHDRLKALSKNASFVQGALMAYLDAQAGRAREKNS